jgi:ribonuclease HI
VYFDGSLSKKGAGARLIFVSPLGARRRYVVRIHFPTSNNVAEYGTLINGLHIAIELGIRLLEIQGVSQLVVDQVLKESSCRSTKMAAYCQEVHQLEERFDGLELNHIPRWLNEGASMLAKMVYGRELVLTGICASDQYKPSVCYE